MKPLRLFRITASLAILGAFALAASVPASADTITWTDWSAGSNTPGTPGTAKGDMGGITVTYRGQFQEIDLGYPSWLPTATFTTSNPPSAYGIVHMQGAQGAPVDPLNPPPSLPESIAFSSAVTNPVIAIWSLGQSGEPASYDFTASEPFTIIAGGPGQEYGGSSITQSGYNAVGVEGDGVIEFYGTYGLANPISFTTPEYENWYGFTVGESSVPPPPVPEPETLSLLGLGLAMLPFLRSAFARRRRA